MVAASAVWSFKSLDRATGFDYPGRFRVLASDARGPKSMLQYIDSKCLASNSLRALPFKCARQHGPAVGAVQGRASLCIN